MIEIRAALTTADARELVREQLGIYTRRGERREL
jgi:hypothetical protein